MGNLTDTDMIIVFALIAVIVVLVVIIGVLDYLSKKKKKEETEEVVKEAESLPLEIQQIEEVSQVPIIELEEELVEGEEIKTSIPKVVVNSELEKKIKNAVDDNVCSISHF